MFSIENENETESDIYTPTLKLNRSIFEIDSARKFSLGAEVSKIAKVETLESSQQNLGFKILKR